MRFPLKIYLLYLNYRKGNQFYTDLQTTIEMDHYKEQPPLKPEASNCVVASPLRFS